jgi:hypothetical protein
MILIERVLKNYSKEKGMVLGNLLSQNFQNIYLNELDQYIKHELKAKYYIRYVDDFVLLHNNKLVLEDYKLKIQIFLKEKLKLSLHPTKTKIISYRKGVNFLGVRIFPYHKLLRKASIRLIKCKIRNLVSIEKLYLSLQGWIEYASHSNTYNLIKRILWSS